ncbi:MAG: hypothetical protein AAFO82_11360 [Bacteroidota bacterium]
MRLLSALMLLLALLFVACEPAASEDNTEETTEEEAEATTATYTLTAFDQSTAYPDAKIDDMMYADGKFKFPITATDYVLGAQTPDAESKMCANSGKGQHIHLIVDNAPYAAKYENEFDYELEDGEHYILAFLSRSYHESIKTAEAHILKKVTVENAAFTASEAVEEPMLFYSRPKGTYIGEKDTKKIMLDFYVANATLGADYKVKVDINGEDEKIVDVWQPYYLEGLPMGDNKIKLTLIDAEGNAVDTPLNPVERVFTLKEDPVEEM